MRGPPDEDLYERLGVSRGADAREIRRRYLDLAGRYHPDRHQGNPLGDLAQERLAQINAAYDVLSDPARRAAYDGRAASSGHAAGFRGGPEPPGARDSGGSSDPRRNPGRSLVATIVLAVGTLLALRLVSGIGRFFVAIFTSEPGRILGPILLAGVVGLIVWSRVRRAKR